MNDIPLKDNSGKKKNPLLTVLFVLFNIVVIGYTAYVEFSKDRPSNIEFEFGLINIICLVCALACPCIVLFADARKYVLMMRSLGEKVSLKHSFQVAALGKYYDAVTPSGAGGQPFQIWYLNSCGYSSGISAAMPLAAFISMQFGFVTLALVSFICNNSAIDSQATKITAYIGLFCYVLLPLFIVFFAIAPKAARKIMRFLVRAGVCLRIVKDPMKTEMKIMRALSEYCRSIRSIGKDKLLVFRLLLLSVVHHLALCSIPYFVVRMFGGDLAYVDIVAVCAFIYAAISIIPTPGNSGAAEGLFYALFASLGANCLFWAMLVWRFFCYYFFIVVGIGVYGYNAVADKRCKKVKNDAR